MPVDLIYAPFYHNYVSLVEGRNGAEVLKEGQKIINTIYTSISEEEGNFAYQPGKWSLKELLGHMVDTERIMAYRLLCFSRGEKQSLPGFEENDYVEAANFARLSVANLLYQYHLVRNSTLGLIESLDQNTYAKVGKADNNDLNVKALMSIIPGHEKHHINIIRERYLLHINTKKAV